VIVQLALDDLVGRLDDGLGDFRVQLAQRQIGLGGRALDDAQGPTMPRARTTGRGCFSQPILKLPRLRCDWAPQ